MRETDKMHAIDEKLEALIEQIDSIKEELQKVEADKLMEEWEEDENDDGYGSEAPEDYITFLENVQEDIDRLIADRGLNL